MEPTGPARVVAFPKPATVECRIELEALIEQIVEIRLAFTVLQGTSVVRVYCMLCFPAQLWCCAEKSTRRSTQWWEKGLHTLQQGQLLCLLCS